MRLTLLTGLFVVMPAVAGAQSFAPRTAGPAVEATTATVQVDNQKALDVDVFLVVGESRQRVGTVVASSTRELALPPGAAAQGAVRIVVGAVGSREEFRSEPLTVAPGDRVRLTVNNPLPQSTVTVLRGGGP